MVTKKVKISYFFSVLFIVYISCHFLLLINSLMESEKVSVKVLAEEYFENINYKNRYLDLYSKIQKDLGKEQIETFTVYKNSYGKLVSPRPMLSDEEITKKVNEMYPIFQYLSETKGVDYVYVTSLLPISSEKDLPLGINDYSKKNAENTLSILNKRLITILDIRESDIIKAFSRDRLFYKTDHHWSNEACFAVYQELVYHMIQNTNLDGIPLYTKEDFEKETQVNSFLGSYGIKIGHLYAGKDDFVFYRPNFATEFEFFSYDQHGAELQHKTGEWSQALMDQNLLHDPDYNNKYNVFLNASAIDIRIINKDAPNNLKVLLISHSYGRPLSQYLALNFSEVRNIDPQEGRFSGNYLDYINEYNPDFVIFLTEFEGEIIGNYKTVD